MDASPQDLELLPLRIISGLPASTFADHTWEFKTYFPRLRGKPPPGALAKYSAIFLSLRIFMPAAQAIFIDHFRAGFPDKILQSMPPGLKHYFLAADRGSKLKNEF